MSSSAPCGPAAQSAPRRVPKGAAAESPRSSTCTPSAERPPCSEEPPSKRSRAELPLRRLTMGSICTGLATCHRAADLIQDANRGFEISFLFACENGRAARAVLAADFPRLRVYGDVCEAEPSLPTCDILTAGFPCQPYSAANRHRKGSADPRSNVVGSILDYVRRARPRIIVLENVIGMLAWGRDTLRLIITAFRQHGYCVELEKLSADRHGGLPQHRRRLYIVAILEPSSPLEWPSAVPMQSLPTLLSDEIGSPGSLPTAAKAASKLRAVESQLRLHGATSSERLYMVANCHSQLGKLFFCRTPCLTAARGAQGGFWLLGKHRMMVVEELLRLQGFNPSQTRVAETVSARQAGALIGNSFALPVIGRVLVSALRSIGCSLEDPFA